MTKTPDDLEKTKRLMAALGRLPPKRHSEMKLGKPKGKRAKRPGARKRKLQAKAPPGRTLLLED
jgi:hypothetical protein